MKHREESEKPSKLNYFFLLPLFLQAAASVLLVLFLVRLGIFQIWHIAIIAALLVAILALNAYLFLNRKRGGVAKTFGLILAAIVVAACYFGSKAVRMTTGFLSEVTGDHVEVQVYEVRALKTSELTTLNQLTDQKIGFISTNPNIEETKTTLKENLANYEAVDYEEVGSMLLALSNQEIPAVVIARSYLGFLEEINSTFEEDTVVLHSMEITVKNLDLRKPVDISKDPFTVYISGSDSRGTINDVADSDVNILAVVNPEQGKILLVNIPRDYQIQIYGTTGLKDKLKSAGRFGIETSKKTIEELLGIEINYVIKVGFQAVEQLVDAIGGIDIDSDVDIVQKDKEYGKTCFINKGTNHLDGKCTLAFSRHRKTLKEGDIDRGKHQQVVLTAIIDKITDLHQITHLPQILNAAKETFQTSLTEKEITDFVRWQLTELKHWKTESIQIGTPEHVLEPTYTISTQNMWMYVRDEESETKAKQKIAEYLGLAPETPEKTEEVVEPEEGTSETDQNE